MRISKTAQEKFDFTGGVGMSVPMMPGYQPNNPLQAQDNAYSDDAEETGEETGEETVVLEFDEPKDGVEEIVFVLPKIPGADDDSDIVVEQDGGAEIEIDEPKDVIVESPDQWDWQSRGISSFLNWLSEMLQNVPRHTGRDTTGLEKAISYFEAVDKEITKAMRMDYKNEIDSAKAEEARAQIEDGLERLVDRLEKVRTSKYKRFSKKKKADESSNKIIKEANTTKINGIAITVPLFISFLARTLINGHVSAGHDLEDMFRKLDKKYKLTDREKAELTQLMLDMNFPMRLDRGLLGEDVDVERSDNFDWAANYVG